MEIVLSEGERMMSGQTLIRRRWRVFEGSRAAMILSHPAFGFGLRRARPDMRCGMNGPSLQVQETLKRDPHAGDLFAFRGRRGFELSR